MRPDGSGTLTETLALSGPARACCAPAATPRWARPRRCARARARLGDGVTLVHTDTLGGMRTTVYAFRDVAALRYRLPDNATEAEDLASVADVPPLYTFAFEPAAGGSPAVLRIETPATRLRPLRPLRSTRPPSPQSLAMARAADGRRPRDGRGRRPRRARRRDGAALGAAAGTTTLCWTCRSGR